MSPRGRHAPTNRAGRHSAADGGSQAGFVLLSVLGLLAVVSAILATVILQLRSGTATTQARGDIVRLQGIADGIARLVAYDLKVSRTYRLAGLDLPEDGTWVACGLEGGRTAFLSIQDQGRLIDVNATPRPAMEEAFRLLGVPDQAALAIAAEIVDYRDPDDVPEPGGGAERPQYRARGLAYGPRNAPFVSVDEIARLPSMTPDIAEILKPVLTVYNEGGRFDLARLVLQVRPQAVRALPGAAKPVPSARQYFRVQVRVEGGRAQAGRSMLYAPGGTQVGTEILTWQEGGATPGETIAHRACPTIAAALGLAGGGPDLDGAATPP